MADSTRNSPAPEHHEQDEIASSSDSDPDVIDVEGDWGQDFGDYEPPANTVTGDATNSTTDHNSLATTTNTTVAPPASSATSTNASAATTTPTTPATFLPWNYPPKIFPTPVNLHIRPSTAAALVSAGVLISPIALANTTSAPISISPMTTNGGSNSAIALNTTGLGASTALNPVSLQTAMNGTSTGAPTKPAAKGRVGFKGEYKGRTACDRCHHPLKETCHLEPGQYICDACKKSGHECKWTYAGTPGGKYHQERFGRVPLSGPWVDLWVNGATCPSNVNPAPVVNDGATAPTAPTAAPSAPTAAPPAPTAAPMINDDVEEENEDDEGGDVMEAETEEDEMEEDEEEEGEAEEEV